MTLALDNVLILSPHRDDEALGCGGLLTSDLLSQAHVRYYNTVHPGVDYAIYTEEARKVAEAGGFETSVSQLTGVNRLSQIPLADFIADIEDAINELEPNALLFPARSRNQDHQVIYDAAMVAIRPHDVNFYVPNVLIYEQAEYMDGIFTPHLFVPIDIEKKIALFELYQSQQRGHRKSEHLLYLAGLRGMQCNQPFAEAFMIVRQTWQPM